MDQFGYKVLLQKYFFRGFLMNLQATGSLINFIYLMEMHNIIIFQRGSFDDRLCYIILVGSFKQIHR